VGKYKFDTVPMKSANEVKVWSATWHPEHSRAAILGDGLRNGIECGHRSAKQSL
jgi:hypothetical protein